MLNKLSAKVIWIINAVLVLAGVGLIIWTANSTGTLTTVLLVFTGIDFFVLTMMIQVASFKTFKFKPKKVNYPTKDYNCDENLFDVIRGASFKERKLSYGSSFLKIDGKKAYKVVLVDNDEAYYAPSESDNYESDKRLDKCTSFVAFEIFLNPCDTTFTKLPDYSIQGENVYYTAFGKKDDKFTCFNFIEPNEKYGESYKYLLNLLKFIEVKNEEE